MKIDLYNPSYLTMDINSYFIKNVKRNIELVLQNNILISDLQIDSDSLDTIRHDLNKENEYK